MESNVLPTYQQLSDLALVQALRQNDRAASDELIRRYYPKVQALCYRYLRSLEDAQDVAQEVFLRVFAHHKIISYSGRSLFWSWLFRVTINTTKTYRYKNRLAWLRWGKNLSLPEETTEPASPQLGPDELILHWDLGQKLRQAIFMLPEKYRLVIYSTFIQEHSCRETAQNLGRSKNTIQVQIHRGKKRLKEIYSRLCS